VIQRTPMPAAFRSIACTAVLTYLPFWCQAPSR
jgi:hypothetical protein